ncbi:acetyl-CoA synthetase-like protein [Gloeophyllum trabeum ATCC 11539]|uniref:Acetyl-CoA synthetase-like protein n=1 Tax=Gloeophyllum trabeum (strain ATCC 11539 / FP-39264 / Madison 617) TaxID=670483 RepID=S7QM25_GLOTA|nr:acetyl-CoA synthetase-like protein [Gloeophyllum trabeum ATCC 11539]EPQ60488.1 acetyl-CoA synthetase-like protein [Gloeophyllum trabeum ATCC 11539]
MVERRGPVHSMPHIPDDLTLAQFMLDVHHPSRPLRPDGVPWLIEDTTGRRVGSEEIRARVFGLANGLHSEFNIKEDDVVCLYSPNHVDYPVAIWATHRLGAVISGANPSYTADELAYQVELVKAKLLIVHPDSLSTAITAASSAGIPVDRIVLFDDASQGRHRTVQHLIDVGLTKTPSFVERRLAPGEAKKKLAFLSFSSGTTGKPKAVAIPHYAPIANVIQMAVHHKVNVEYAPWEKRRFRPGDVAILVLPMYHIYGLVVNLHFMLYSAVTTVVIPRFNFENMLKSIVKYRIVHLFLVPPQIVLLCKHPATKNYDLSHVRFCMAGAAPVSKELTEDLVKILPNADVGQGYGMTETCTVVAMIPTDQKIGVLGSAGQLMPGIVVRVVKEDGSLAKAGELGELVVKSPANALCYLNNPEATAETFIDGWVRTGDEVLVDEQAELFVVDRLKEIMKVRGYQVAPAELEGHLLAHPDVADCCVVGVPDEYSGEVPLAFVVPHVKALDRIKNDPTEAEKVKASIIKHVADHKVNYKHLAGGVEFVDIIPKNPSGKLLRRVLRDKAKALRSKSPVTIKSKL